MARHELETQQAEAANQRLQQVAQAEAEEQAQHRQQLSAVSQQVADRLSRSIGALIEQLVASADELDRSAAITLSSVETQQRASELAQMRSGLPAQPLYRVRFRQKDVWPDYAGSPQDVLEVEIYQHWLEKA